MSSSAGAVAARDARLDGTLLALADPARRGVVELLRQEPRKASDLALSLSLTRPAMSRHLRVLRQTGLVSERGLEHDARVRVYQLERAPFVELKSWLEEVEAFWADQLQAFKAHAERRARPAPAAGKRRRPRTS
jgi:DNA-binding transcriptional ArsR family regulator